MEISSLGPIIKELTPPDWLEFKNIRLKALIENPDVFCPTSNEFERSDEEWKDLLSNNSPFKIFTLWLEKEVIGLTGIVTYRDDSSSKSGLFVMSFIEPKYRGRGYSKYLYEARISWAKKSNKYTRLVVGHREGNEASRRANQKYGFKLIGIVDHKWLDGTIDKLYNYELLV